MDIYPFSIFFFRFQFFFLNIYIYIFIFLLSWTHIDFLLNVAYLTNGIC
jgi:hypothetical protein